MVLFNSCIVIVPCLEGKFLSCNLGREKENGQHVPRQIRPFMKGGVCAGFLSSSSRHEGDRWLAGVASSLQVPASSRPRQDGLIF